MNADKPQRLLSLDVLRGATVLAMILVNNPGDWGALYWPLGHANWHGWTPTDLIFPFFVYMVGVAMAYSLAKYVDGSGAPTAGVWTRIVRRVVVLILLGLLISESGEIVEYLLGRRADLGLATLRWPGVLQRIGLAYLGSSMLALLAPWRAQVVAGVLLLAGYGLALRALPSDIPAAQRMEQETNVVREVDLAVIGEDHMWTRAKDRPTDPEGLLSTLPAIVTAQLGYAVGRLLRRRGATTGAMTAMLVGGAALTGAGLALGNLPPGDPLMPINKALWTPSFVLLTGGLATLSLLVCLALFDVVGAGSKVARRIASAFELVGVNAIFAFVGSGIVARMMGIFHIGDSTVRDWVYRKLLLDPLVWAGWTDASEPKLASLAYAAAYVALWWVVLWGMWRRGWSIRV